MIILRRKLTDSRVYLVVVEVLWAERRWLNIVALTLNCKYRAVWTEHQPGPGRVAGLRGHRVSRGQARHRGRGRGLLPLLGGVLLGPAAAREEHHGHCHGGHEAVTEVRQQSRCQGDTEDITEAGASVEGPGVRCELATADTLRVLRVARVTLSIGGLRPRPSKINSSWQPPARLRHRGGGPGPLLISLCSVLGVSICYYSGVTTSEPDTNTVTRPGLNRDPQRGSVTYIALIWLWHSRHSIKIIVMCFAIFIYVHK